MKADIMAEAMLTPGFRSGSLSVTLASTNDNHEENDQNAQKQDSRNVPDVVTSSDSTHKRQKPSAPVTASQVIEELAKSVSSEERLSAIASALACFDHDNTTVHDEEVSGGAASMLCKQLAFLLMKMQLSCDEDRCTENDLWREIGYTCSALEMVYRCSTPKLAESFHLIGSELLPLLLTVMAHCVQTSEGDPLSESSMIKADGSVISITIMKSTKILGHFATVTTALVPMACQKGLLSMMKRIVTSRVADKARFNALWTLANLACDADNMVLMACHPGLLDSLVNVAYQDKSFEARTQSAKAIMNLSWRPENKIPMSERQMLLDAMMKLVGSSIIKTRRHAARSFRFLSDTPPKNKLRLCRHGDGKLLAALLKRACHDTDRSVRECTMTTLHNLACEETAEIMGEHPGLLMAFAKVAAVAERGSAPTIAGEALYVLAEHLNSTMNCYAELQKSLDAVAAKKEEISPSNWSPRQQNILRRLANMRQT